MFIDNITADQKHILDILWQIDTEEECKRWLNSLPKSKRQTAFTLMEMIMLADIDEEIEEMEDEFYPEAVFALQQMGIPLIPNPSSSTS